ncbi:hypothetical protein CMU26_01000 [Elizabethkingia anophelis]|nr:hypothetical protein [Elizabethkingia anophelis]
MENKLKPMTDFVLSILNNTSPNNFVKGVESIRAYAEFLKQSLALCMFAPCDVDGKPLEECNEPNKEDYWDIENDVFNAELYNYNRTKFTNLKKAQSRVLFEGFEIEMSKNRVDIYFSNYNHISYSRIQNNFSSPSKYLTTIEDLIIYSGLTLTETAIKQMYGS